MSRDSTLLLLNKGHVEVLLSPDEVVVAVRESFLLHYEQKGRLFPVVRERLGTGGIFGIKSGDVEAHGLLGFKAAGFWPGNRLVGSEPHQATIVLIDPHSGRPICVIDGNAITTIRTGAAGALGLAMLARPESTTMCVFGTGVQAQIQTRFALDVLPSLRHVQYMTSGGGRDPEFESLFASRCEVKPAGNANAAVAASDVVITATPGRSVLFDCSAVCGGTHISCIGADTRGKRELPAGLLERASVYVDDSVQSVEIGELQWAPTVSCSEFGEVLANGLRVPRTSQEITIFDLTGLALQDLVVARMLYMFAGEEGVGTTVEWPW
ncbi:ornithine cyclodeaminase family protein [Paraburkholderia sp. RP-4-7]|uniref:Ornithine cyclodeaminase family protein n=1 Tax=Paraburkholderia polaris TaxID=2728848 RepID=A0A848IMH1_9BURK|nr:ornithine cyclodeaminase family protein [Paraburkholderia polaris]NMM03512.1 ornithine cyclodeaminase family protein [Paraburkholderia polaris]